MNKNAIKKFAIDARNNRIIAVKQLQKVQILRYTRQRQEQR